MAEIHHEFLCDMKMLTANEDCFLIAKQEITWKISHTLNPGYKIIFQC